ncbi:MAG: hypothetical protein ISS79_13390 [Phycisphaerae bacterium]|nr:hypothetical protein [Phycisphaerae bacterium]
MDAEYQKLVQQVEDAVNQGPDEGVISGSEELVRDAMARFRQKVYEKAIQLRTEGFCKILTARLKGSGMRWDSSNAEGIMALAAMDQSGQWPSYWNLQNALAA